tara:strand:- start:309 stop:818 length:510 start_codon:yes stop_codon:yes gene_type:complete
MKFLKFFFLYSIFFLININAYGNDRVSFLDLDFVVQNSNIGKTTLNKINKLNDQNIEKLKLRENEIKENENEIKKKKNIISEDQFKKEIDLLKNKVNEFRTEKDIMVNNLNKLKNDELNILFQKINPIIQEYMDKKSIEILLDRKSVFIGKVTSDITSEIIEQLNKKFE